MIFNMVGGGGASGASVFAINSVDERPTNVSDNTLWVNTDIDVTKYIFSNNEPSSPIEGMLWLTTLDDSGVNVVAPINKDWMEFNLGLVRQYIGGAWERKLAQLYKDGVWVNVSKIFAAYINITYPANSTCVVTNSSGQTVANDTNTTSSEKTFTAIVGSTGTYTVTATATDGSRKSKSQDVSITTEGQLESVELSYALVIIENGELAQGYAWENPDVYAPVYEVIKPIIANVKQYKNMVYTIYIDTLVNSSAYFEIGLFSGLSHASSVVQTTKYDQSSGILNAGNAKEFVVPIASTVPNDCYIGTYHASLRGHIIDLRLE